MKKIKILLITIFLLTLVGCSDKTMDEDIDLATLPYYSYLSDDNPVITIHVQEYGVMKLQLFPEVAKNTVDNLITYINEDSYTKSTFHRIIADFMIQGGIVPNTTSPIQGEFASNGITNDLAHNRGVISMARTNVKNSATSQFFIVHKDSPHLNGDYASFGGLYSGFNVLDVIATKDVAIIDKITVTLNGYKLDEPVYVE